MSTLLRKTFTGVVAAVSLGAMVAATSTPAAAWGYGRRGWGGGPGIAAGVIGALAVGAIAASAARPAYATPVYGYPAYGPPVAYDTDGYAPVCHREWRPLYTSDGVYLRDRLVRVCD